MRKRIERVAVLSTVVAFMLFLLPLALVVFNLSVADTRSQLERDALAAVAQIDPQFSAGDVPELTPPSDSRVELALYDRAGTRIAGTGPAHADAAATGVLSGAPDQRGLDDPLVAVVPVTSSEQVVGAVRASLPLAVVVAGDLGVWATMVVGAAMCLLVGVLLARATARRVAAPMEDLARTAQALGDGDFQARVAPSGVAEIDAAGIALGETADRLGALVERERRLSQDASHQLRTPLAGLRAILESAQVAPQSITPAVIDRALERVDALAATVDEFLSTERTPRGRPTDVASEVRGLEERWHGVLAAAGRPLRVDAADRSMTVVTVPESVRQILDVLLENAHVHGAGEVVVRVRESRGAIAIDVEDEGGSIAAGDDIFRRGYSGAGRNGYGLALAQQLAEELGGRLLLSSRLPVTRFTLLLPQDADSSGLPASGAPR
ncbi:HAMP domain-containing sensor histidine kinase [Microbacterium deminutum]|uniref:histidine kinase n=1 Tax=Microbacterium deminutum TaxID=344164 RepID=A0ABN2R1W4_9MICO